MYTEIQSQRAVKTKKKTTNQLHLGLRMLKFEFIQDIVILNICMKLNQYWSIEEGAN